MKKGLVTLGVIVLLVAVFASVLYKTQDLEFAGAGVNQVTDSGISLTLLACNPSIFPQNIETMQAVLYFQSNNIGTLDVTAKTIPSGSQATMDGTITFSDFDSMKNFVGWVLDNQNPSDFKATMLVKTKILNMIPRSYQKSYDLPGFVNLIFGNQGWSCNSKQGLVETQNIKEQLSLAQSRLSAAELLYSGNSILGNTTKNDNYTNSNTTNILNP